MNEIRILVLYDGRLHMQDGDYGLAAMSRVLSGYSDSLASIVLRASHVEAFDSTDLEWADQLWLFGDAFSPGEYWPTQRDAIAAFMEAGGGVFATGDHDAHGFAMCGNLPKIRQMRYWGAGNAPKWGEDAISTIAPTITAAEDDLFSKPVFPDQARPTVHELMRLSSGGAIRWLPDHAHEGQLNTGSTGIAANYSDFSDAQREHIKYVAWTIAWGISAGVTSSPRAVPVVRCWTPEPGNGAGRIVVDSTFHHWLGFNVENLMIPGQEERLEHWTSYALNIATFLAAQERVDSIGRELVSKLKQLGPIANSLRNHHEEQNVGDVRWVTEQALARLLRTQPLAQRVLRRYLDVSSFAAVPSAATVCLCDFPATT